MRGARTSRKVYLMATKEFREGPRPGSGAAAGKTVLAMPFADRLVMFVGIPALVLLLGLGLPALARWALSWDTALPFKPVFRFVGAIDKPWEIAVNLTIWLLLATVVVFTAARESMRVTVTDAAMRVEKDDQVRTFARDDVSAVFLDGKKLVVLDQRSRQLLRDTHEASRSTLAEGFRRHGYPWYDSDPYTDLFRPWSAGSAELPEMADDVLAARQSALRTKAHPEVRSLAAMLEKMGYVVRDEGARQFWRPLVKS